MSTLLSMKLNKMLSNAMLAIIQKEKDVNIVEMDVWYVTKIWDVWHVKMGSTSKMEIV